MRDWKKTACLIGSVVFCLLLFEGSRNQNRNASAPEENQMIIDVPVSALEGAALVNESGTIAFAVQNGEICILEDQPMKEGEYSATERKAFLYQMAHLKAKRKLEKNAESDWEKFGFNPYRAVIVLLGTNGERFCCYLGDPSPLKDGWYVRREEDDSLWLIDDLPAEMMQYSLNQFKNQQVWPDLRSYRLADLNQICVIHEDTGVAYAIRGKVMQGAARFAMEEPYQLSVDWEVVNEKVFEPLMQMRSLDLVDLAAEKDPFLEGEVYTLELQMSGIRTQLRLVKAEDGAYYCRNSESEQTIRIPDTIETILNSTAEDFVSTSLYTADPANMEQIVIIAGNKEAVLELKGQGEALWGSYRNKELNQKEVIAFLEKLFTIPPAESLAEEENLEGEAAVTLYIRMRDGKEDSLCLLPLSERRYAVQINGQAAFTTYSQTAERLLALLEK